ncbi:hypothetical protein PF002_g19638 [Phytophthora fragariae]|uniref:Uncharacterized protein n=1 Tax=Phytophthora fragariae TaxID=53985 RepID=A0A6A3XUV9_9STRA|nr:hypothetical protein PF002_g19638 [Phytophthora fragariae]
MYGVPWDNGGLSDFATFCDFFMDGYRTRLVPTRKTPTPEKTFCATAPPSSIAHLVGRIHRHGDVHTGQEVQERSAGAETYMQPSAGRPIPGQDATTRDQQPLCSTQPTGMRTVPRVRISN